MKFSKVIVALVIIQVFVYTWIHLILSCVIGTELAPTVSCAFYAFCGAEAGLLAWIKTSEKKEENENEGTDFSETDEP